MIRNYPLPVSDTYMGHKEYFQSKVFVFLNDRSLQNFKISLGYIALLMISDSIAL